MEIGPLALHGIVRVCVPERIWYNWSVYLLACLGWKLVTIVIASWCTYFTFIYGTYNLQPKHSRSYNVIHELITSKTSQLRDTWSAIRMGGSFIIFTTMSRAIRLEYQQQLQMQVTTRCWNHGCHRLDIQSVPLEGVMTYISPQNLPIKNRSPQEGNDWMSGETCSSNWMFLVFFFLWGSKITSYITYPQIFRGNAGDAWKRSWPGPSVGKIPGCWLFCPPRPPIYSWTPSEPMNGWKFCLFLLQNLFFRGLLLSVLGCFREG